MPENVSLGTVSAEVKIGLSQVIAARNQLKQELGQIGSALDKLADQAEKDGKRTEEALKRAASEKELAKMRTNLKATADAQKQLWDEVGRGSRIAGTAITGVLVGATAAASKFDGAMRNVNSIAKLSEKQFQQTSKAVLRLVDDKRITDGPIELSKGLYDVYSSGKQGAEALEILKEASTGATAGLTDTATSSRVLMAVLNSGVGGVNSAKEAMDVLFKIVDRGVGNFEQLAGSLGAVLPMASKAGVSLQEIGAYLAVATKSGQSFAEGVNDLNNLLQKIIKPGKDTQKLFEEHGISFGMAALQGKGLSGVLQEIMEKTKGNQQALADLFPDMQAFRGVLTASAKEGRDFTRELGEMKTATEGVGAKQAALNEQMKSSAYQVAKAKQELERMAIEVGQHLLPVARDLMKDLHGVTQAFHNLSPASQSAIVKFTLFGGVALTIIGNVVSLILKLKELQALMVAGGLLGNLARFGPYVAAAAGTATMAYLYGGGAETDDLTAKTKEQNASLPRLMQIKSAIPYLKDRARYMDSQARSTFMPAGPNDEEGEALRIAGLGPQAKASEIRAAIEKLEKEKRTTALQDFKKQAAAASPKGKKPDGNPNPQGNGGGGGGGGEESDAAKKAEQDRLAADAITKSAASKALDDRYSSLMEDYQGRYLVKRAPGGDPNKPEYIADPQGESLRDQLVKLMDQAYRADLAVARAKYDRDKKDSPREAMATLKEAMEEAARKREGRSREVRGKDKEQLDVIQKDKDEALLTRMKALEEVYQNGFDEALSNFSGNREDAMWSSDGIKAQQEEIARQKFKLATREKGAPVEKAKAELAANLAKVEQDDIERRNKIAEAEGELGKEEEERDKKRIKASLEQNAYEKRLALEMLEFLKENNQIRTQDYIKALDRQLAGEVAFSEAWMELMRKRQAAQAELDEAAKRQDDETWRSAREDDANKKDKDARLNDFYNAPLTGFKESIANELGDSIAHFHSFSDFFEGWKSSLVRGFQDLAAQVVTNWARVQLMGSAAAGVPGAAGGAILGGLGSAIPIVGGALALNSILGNPLKKLFRFAEGGIMMPGVPAMIGDSHQAANGEWVIPRVQSAAIPAGMLDQIASRAIAQGGMGGGGVHAPITIHVAKIDGATDIDALGQQIAWHLEQRQKVS